MLKSHFKNAIAKKSSEVFSMLEDKERKVINIQSGSLIFKLFCPTKMSRLQLQDENWSFEMQLKIGELLKLLGQFFFLLKLDNVEL